MSIRIDRMASAFAGAIAILLNVTAAGTVSGTEKVTTIAAPHGGRPIKAEIDLQGTIHLLCDSPHGPQYSQSTDNGKTFSKSIPVIDRESRKPGLEFSAWDMAVGPPGFVHVAMGTNAWKLKLPQEEWAFFYARLDPGAESFSPVRNINRKPSEGFSLAADDKGNVTACWLSGKLYANISHNNGKTFAPAVEIDPAFDPCDCCTTSTVYGADGRLAVLYREETDNDRDMFLALWDQNRNAVMRTRVSTTAWKIDSCPMSYYSVVRNDDGYVAVWPTRGQIYFARLDGKGNPQSPAEIKTPGTTGMRTGMLALRSRDGSTLVAWKKDGQLNWQLYDQGGHPAGPPASAKSAGQGAAGAVDKNGDFVLFR